MMSKNINNNDVGGVVDVPPASASASAYKVRRLFTFPAETATATAASSSSSGGITDTTTVEETVPTTTSATNPTTASSSTPDNTYPTTGWYRDPITGRFTNDSNEYNGEDEEGGDNSNVVGYHELVPESNGITPTVTYQEAAPFYPVRYSCESAVTANVVGNNGQIRITGTSTDASIDTTGTGTGTGTPHANASTTTMTMVEVSAPVELEFLLPTSINDVEENVDALQWSILKSLAEQLGLSRRCDLDRQHGGAVLDGGDSATSGGDVNEDQQDIGGVNNHSNLRRRRRHRERHLIRKPRKVQEEGGIENGGDISLELQYPTSIYAVGSNPAVEWTGKFRCVAKWPDDDSISVIRVVILSS